MICV